jgi:hypothetical protein
MPVHGSIFGTNQNDEYSRVGGRNEHSDSVPELHAADVLRDIA